VDERKTQGIIVSIEQQGRIVSEPLARLRTLLAKVRVFDELPTQIHYHKPDHIWINLH
jgi:hypothetical protein